MNDLFVSEQDIRNDLVVVRKLRDDLVRILILLSQKLKYIFSKIKECPTLESAKEYFNLLDDIQEELSLFVFEEGIGIPERLEHFVREFDRYFQDREKFFQKIKNGEIAF